MSNTTLNSRFVMWY